MDKMLKCIGAVKASYLVLNVLEIATLCLSQFLKVANSFSKFNEGTLIIVSNELIKAEVSAS